MQAKDKTNKIETISTAFLDAAMNGLPKEEQWFKDRMYCCNICPYNTKNAKHDKLSDRVVSALNKTAHLGYDSCELCGCFIAIKCSDKNSACALEDSGSGMEKWSRVDFETLDSDSFDLINGNPNDSIIRLSPDKTMFEVYYRPVKRENTDKMESTLILKFRNNVSIQKALGSCNCMTTRSKFLSDSLYEINSVINLDEIPPGAFSKQITVSYLKDGGEHALYIKLRGEKA